MTPGTGGAVLAAPLAWGEEERDGEKAPASQEAIALLLFSMNVVRPDFLLDRTK